jgi:hypothetical protein
MPETKLIHWIDAGMAIMAGVFIAIVLFLSGEDYLVPVLLGYGAALIVWAFLAELAVVRAEREEAPGYLYGEMTGMGGVAGFIPIHESQVDDWKARLAGDPVSEKPPDISWSHQGGLSRSTKSGKPTRRNAMRGYR